MDYAAILLPLPRISGNCEKTAFQLFERGERERFFDGQIKVRIDANPPAISVKKAGSVANYAFAIVRLDRRDLVWIGVTRHPTAEWIARQITEAFPWRCHVWTTPADQGLFCGGAMIVGAVMSSAC